ncbi:MAG: hypothetical protein ACREOZ_05315 [Gloeomargaritales cyanobacterium]
MKPTAAKIILTFVSAMLYTWIEQGRGDGEVALEALKRETKSLNFLVDKTSWNNCSLCTESEFVDPAHKRKKNRKRKHCRVRQIICNSSKCIEQDRIETDQRTFSALCQVMYKEYFCLITGK